VRAALAAASHEGHAEPMSRAGHAPSIALRSDRIAGAIALVFLLLAVTLVLLGTGTANASSTPMIGGWVRLATAVVAWYASFAV